MKKKLLSVILVAALIGVTTLMGCATGSKSSAKHAKLLIGATGLQEDQFTQVMIQGYKDEAKKLGIDIMTVNSQHSSETETTQINNMIAAGAKGIIIEPVNPDTSAAIAQTAASKGCAVFACAIQLNSKAVFASALNDCYDLGSSTGTYATDYFAKHFTKSQKINVAIIAYDAQDATGSANRVNGFLDKLKGYDINIVARQDGEVADKAYAATNDMLTAHPDIDVFFAASENGVDGCVNALIAKGNPHKAVVFGVDASQQIVEMLKSNNNIMQATTAQDPYYLGTYAVNATYNYIKNGTKPKVTEYHAPCIAVNRSDIKGADTWLANWLKYAGGK